MNVWCISHPACGIFVLAALTDEGTVITAERSQPRFGELGGGGVLGE